MRQKMVGRENTNLYVTVVIGNYVCRILPETILRLVCLTHSGITSASNVAFKKTPETVKNKRQITDSGVCVQFVLGLRSRPAPKSVKNRQQITVSGIRRFTRETHKNDARLIEKRKYRRRTVGRATTMRIMRIE